MAIPPEVLAVAADEAQAKTMEMMAMRGKVAVVPTLNRALQQLFPPAVLALCNAPHDSNRDASGGTPEEVLGDMVQTCTIPGVDASKKRTRAGEYWHAMQSFKRLRKIQEEHEAWLDFERNFEEVDYY